MFLIQNLVWHNLSPHSDMRLGRFHMSNHLRNKINLNNIYKFSFYVTGNTLQFHNKSQPLNPVYGNNRRLFFPSNQTHKYIFHEQSTEHFMIKTFGISCYSLHCALRVTLLYVPLFFVLPVNNAHGYIQIAKQLWISINNIPYGVISVVVHKLVGLTNATFSLIWSRLLEGCQKFQSGPLQYPAYIINNTVIWWSWRR